jgi:hypothetical protein
VRALCLIRKEPYYRRAAFEQGLKRVGFTQISAGSASGPEDWLIVWNRHIHEAQADAWEANGGTVIVAENGYLQKVDKTHYAISVHGHNGNGWFPVGGEDRFSKLGFPVKDWRPDNFAGYELVCGQRGIGSRTMKSPPGWGETRTRRLSQVGFTVKFRPHPGNHPPRVPLVADLAEAKTCHIWSSASGVMSLVEGVPVHHSAPHWICENGNGETERLFALHRMSHAQWKHEEIATGEPFARVIEHRSKAAW